MTFTGDFTGTRTLDVASEAIVEGSTFADRYAIEGRLGAGAQSTVYSALDMQALPPRRVALKIARSDETNLSRDADLLNLLHRNGDVLGAVRLVEQTVQVFGRVEYLVLEHIDGPTLRGLVLPLRDVCLVGSALARTLALIHEANIVLADVKPENILLHHGVYPVIIDFGAARQLLDSKTPHLLTPAYASPEQHTGQSPTSASDIYALAVVLEELAGPRRPQKFGAVLDQAKSINPAKRPSALEFSRALEAASLLPSKTRIPVYVAVLAGLLMLVVGTIAVMRKPDPESLNASTMRLQKPLLIMISEERRVLYLGLGDAHVYWSDGDGRTVFRAPLGGGNPETVLQLDNAAHQLAVSGQTLFIRTPGEIWSFADEKLARFAESTGSGGIVADRRNAVWTNEQTGDVVVANVRNDAPLRVIASGQARPYSIAMDATHVYWANEENGTLARVAREGGYVEVLARKQSWPAGTALDETHLYWIDRTAGLVMRIPKGGGEPQRLAKTSVGSFSTALSGTHVYWTSRDDDRVLRVPKTGGVPEVVAQGQASPFDIVASGNDVFFSKNHVSWGGVMRLVVP